MGTFKRYIDRVWQPFRSANPQKPKKSGQRDERRHPEPPKPPRDNEAR